MKLPRDLEEFWLDVRVDDPGALAPSTADEMEAYEVSTLVNSAANDGPEVIATVA